VVPADERSVAVALFDSGSGLGGALAIPWVAMVFGWRWSFASSGMLGFVCLFAWLRIYHPVAKHPRLTTTELAIIRGGQDAPPASPRQGWARWLHLARDRNLWGIVLGRALTDPIWWLRKV